MDIFDYAMKMEKEGEALYKGFAKAAEQKGLAAIFNELAEAENKHYQIFKKMQRNELPDTSDTVFLDNVKSIFADWRRNKNKINLKTTQTDLYRKALDIEQKSIDFYLNKSKEVKDDGQKKMLEQIANEEKSHYMIIENIIEFLTTPERWVEHAEFSKIGETY